MKALLILNGECTEASLEQIASLDSYKLICTADGGYHHAKQLNINVDILVGDFDSIESNTFNDFNGDIKYALDQNLTDFDKALALLHQRGIKQVDVLAATGKSSDHFLGNLDSCLRWKKQLRITLFDDYGYYFFSDKSTQLTDVNQRIISLIPFSQATAITTSGLKYSLNKETLQFGQRIGTRNQAIEDDVLIDYEQGELLIFVGCTFF